MNKSVHVPTSLKTLDHSVSMSKIVESSYMKQIKDAKKGHVSPYKRDRKFEKEYLKTKQSISKNNYYRIDSPNAYSFEAKKAPVGYP